MGGKKKTKWRKLPLEEFTKEIPTKPDQVPSDDACQIDSTEDENNFIPSYNEPSETTQNYTETYEYIDGLWYPSSCVVYNPTEIGLYSNYMMPLDACYYYYTMPEMPQVQDYVSMPYQEYTSALPKDTVYLLLPTQTLRPSQPTQNLAPEWQNRRRRRRYEGYADYAVIPEKQSTIKSEERDRSNATGQFINSRRNSAQFNNFRRMTSETSKFNEYNSVSGQNPSCSKSNDVKKNSKLFTDMNNVKGPSKENAESNQKSKKNLEMCGIHSKYATEKNNPHTMTETNPASLNLKNEYSEGDICGADEEKSFSSELVSDTSNSSCSNPINESVSKPVLLCNKKTYISEEQTDKTDMNFLTNEVSECNTKLLVTNQEIKPKTKNLSLTSNETSTATISLVTEDIPKTNSQCSLPDILSTLNKASSSEKKQESGDSNENLPDAVDHKKGISPKSKSFLSQTSYLSNLLSSEALQNEMEMELKQLQNLHSLQTNQSIYKLAYDENVTDQSEADSRSPSPVDPESQVPSSITSAEILIHEADSGSDAGSEDVELLPHRYESETFLNENKHVYINKLSLAVELLRTQESLPYDDEFKRVVGENQPNNIMPGVHSGGKVNLGFQEDSCSPNTFDIKKHSDNKSAIPNTNVNDISQCQLKHSANSSNDSAIFSDLELDNFEEELCETAKEAVAQGNEIQDNTEEIRAGYRRIGAQARHYFSPRAALSFNPCFCCIIM